jgi:hypothetical protein
VAKYSTGDLIALHSSVKGRMGQWYSTWDRVALLMHPGRLGFNTRTSEGTEKTWENYDSIGMEALDDLAAFLQASMTPQEQIWFELGFKDRELDKDDLAKEWIQRCSDILRKEIEDSNFYSVAGEFYKDISGFGTAAMVAEPKLDVFGRYMGLAYRCPHLRGIYGIENQYGECDTVIEEWSATPGAWISRFGANAGKDIQRLARVEPDKEITFLHTQYPRDADEIDQRAISLQMVPDDRMPYASVWINLGEARPVSESGYLMPAMAIARWDANTDNLFCGHGPGLRALPSVGTVNEATRLELEAWEKNIDPPIAVLENCFDARVDLGAGAINIASRMDGWAPMRESTNWNLSVIKREELKESIERIMFSDLIREPTDTNSGTTAYEVAKRMERAQRILGEAVGRIKSEWLTWLVKRSFQIMYTAEQFPEAPESVADAELDVRYVSPLATAQNAAGLESMRMFAADISGLAAIQNPENPGAAEVLDLFDFDGYAKESAERYNVPATGLRGEEDIEKIRAERRRREAEARTLAQTEQVGNAVSAIGGGAGQDVARGLIERIGNTGTPSG